MLSRGRQALSTSITRPSRPFSPSARQSARAPWTDASVDPIMARLYPRPKLRTLSDGDVPRRGCAIAADRQRRPGADGIVEGGRS